MRSLLLSILLLATAAYAQPADTTPPCLVVGVSDGDTITARCGAAGAFKQVKVRLAEIDAPEKEQPFGTRAKLSLSALCFGALATIQPEKQDRYGRTVARVECRGQDASAEQLRRGMAWWYVAYGRDRELQAIEREARAAQAGLWREAEPTPPWEWRRKLRQPAPPPAL